MSLTVRVEDDIVLVSNDDGDTWRPSAAVAEELRVAAEESSKSGHRSDVRDGGTAVLRGTLGEAQRLQPREHPDPMQSKRGIDGTSVIALGTAVNAESRPLRELLDSRHSERRLEPPGFGELATLLVRAGRVRNWEDLPGGGQRETRAMPSAGACHPVDLFVLTTGTDDLAAGLWRFDPVRCELHLQADDVALLDRVEGEFLGRGLELVGGFTAIFVVADFGRTLHRYPAGSTLVWRDAGVILGGLHLCAADVGLGSCVVGSCGLLSEYLDETPDIGAVLIGRSASGRD